MIEGLPKVGETLRDAEKTEKTFRERPREKQRDRAEAKKTLLKAFAISPEDTKIISNLGYLAEKQGNKEEAQKYFTAVLEFDPNDIIAASELAKLEASN